MIKDNINYLIQYIGTPSQFQSYLDDVTTMIDSFQIQTSYKKFRQFNFTQVNYLSPFTNFSSLSIL